MFQPAMALMQEALELKPDLWTAWLHLGLMHMALSQSATADDKAEHQKQALAAWQQLEQLDPQHYLF